MIWLKAIWVNLKSALESFLAAAIIVAIMFAMMAIVSAVLFGVGWVINYFFGAAGVLYSVIGVFGVMAVGCVIAFIRQCYAQIKSTKERLERLETSRVG